MAGSFAALEQLPAQLAEAQSQLKAAEASFSKKLEEQTQSSLARENAVKDSCQQLINALDSSVEMLSQRIRARNMVVHGLPDTAAVSNPAALERLVKDRVDSHRGSSPVSQSITAVTRIGRPGAGNRAVLVEYSSSQAKHKTYALSRQLRQQGISLTDELTPKQQQAQKPLDPDRIALRSKGFRTWFRRGSLWYLDQGVPRECKQGEAVRLPQTQGSPPRPNIPSARAPPRGRPRQTPGRSGGSVPAGTPRANRVVAPVPASCQPPPRPASPAAGPPGPSYAFVAGGDPVAAMDTGPPAPVGPAACPVSAAAAAPSCTPTATIPDSPASSPAGPPAPTNPQ
ncbi:TPA: hypothetical protein ACH3X1_000373 [Trebouxia sp. C0004]